MTQVNQMAQTELNENLTTEAQLLRYLKCRADIFEFAKYAKIEDATTQRVIPFVMWSHIRLLLTCMIQPHAQIALGKAKQIGCSWAAGLFHLWKCHRPAANVLCFSRGQDEAADLLRKSRIINENMPSWLQLRVGFAGEGYISFADTGGRIKAFPSTESAGVGQTATHVTRDELEFHEHAEENYAHVKPTVDAGASILDMSTFDRSSPQSHFKVLYNRALRGENNYKPLFFPWWVRPGRDRAWYEKTRRDYFPIWLFEQDYPDNLQEAMGSIEGEGLFDRSSVDRLYRNVREPLEILSGSTHIFHRPNPKLKYFAGLDGAEGRGGHNSVLWIGSADGQDLELVAIMCSNQLTADIFAIHAYRLLELYARPLLVGGSDPWTQMILQDLSALGYTDRIYCSDEKGEKLGYIETEVNKQQRLMSFAFAVRDGMKVPFKQAVDEMAGWSMVRGKYISTYPTDDCILAGANALVAKDAVPREEFVTIERFY